MLAATEEILAESGVARLSTKEIARRASVAESSIFYHFNDRLGLLKAVVETHRPGFRQTLADIRAGGGSGELRDDLVALLESLEAFYLRITPILAAVQSDGELRARFTDRGVTEEIGPRRGVTALAEYLDAERAAGRVRADLDSLAVAQLLTGVAFQRAALIRLSGPQGVPAGGVEPMVDVLLPSLVKP